MSNYTPEKLMSFCVSIRRMRSTGVVTDEEAASIYLHKLGYTPEVVAESYESLPDEVKVALKNILDKGDVEFYLNWNSNTSSNTPRVRRITISDETDPSIVTVMLGDSDDDMQEFAIEPNHPARLAIECLRKYLGHEDKCDRNWSLPLSFGEASNVRRKTCRHRRVLPNSAVKRMLRSCFVWQNSKEITRNQWIVYEGDVTVVFDAVSELYAQMDSNGGVGCFETLASLVARLETEIDPSLYPNPYLVD